MRLYSLSVRWFVQVEESDDLGRFEGSEQRRKGADFALMLGVLSVNFTDCFLCLLHVHLCAQKQCESYSSWPQPEVIYIEVLYIEFDHCISKVSSDIESSSKQP